MTNHPIWQQQCDAARGIRERFGNDKALGYLLGEKLLTFLWAADHDPELAADLPRFVAEIKAIFGPSELREYLSEMPRLGFLGHTTTDEEFETLRAAGAIEDDVVSAAQDVIRIERMKSLLLDKQ
jgi:hypothetical protein